MSRGTSSGSLVGRICSAALGLALALAIATPAVSAHASSAPPGRVTLAGHTIPALKHLTPTGATAGGQKLHLAISLRPRNDATLEALLVGVSDKTSPDYHHYLTPAQFAQAFGRTTAEIQAIESYLRGQGIQVTSVAPNNLLIDATASVSAAERVFGVQIANYTLQGRAVYAPTNDPSLPASISGMVRAIVGLNNVGIQRSHAISGGPVTHARQHPNGGSGPGGFYGPTDLRNAYDMNTLVNSDSGSGSKIAIFELDGYISSDISTYRTFFGLPALSVSNILVDGATNTAGAGAGEVTLDMEIASAIAPNATQEIYIGPNNGGSGPDDTYTKIATDDLAKVVSTSWGLCEAFQGNAELAAEDGIFQQYAAQGQALFDAAGDTGAYDCRDGVTVSVESPSDDPNVVSVGGTSLTTGTNAAYSSETVWSDSVNGLGGGGGQSSYFSMPTYQRGPNVIEDETYFNGSTNREVPDVAADADPNTGYDVYCSSASGCGSPGWYAFGGTSAAAPLWAAIAVDTNQYLTGLSKPTLGSASAEIYEIFNHPQPFSPYHDITVGDNLLYSAETNYDMASGVGSPDVWNFARDAAAETPTSLAKTWYFAEGYTGTGFTEYLTLANPNAATAHVSVKYLLQGQAPVTKSYTVNPNARKTLNVNTELGLQIGVSMVVTSDTPIIAERPMYFTFTGSGLNVPGGTDVLGATSLGTQFDFGYLDTTANHATYLTVLNQNASTMSVSVKYLSQSGVATTVSHSVSANSRGTILTNSDVSAGIYSAQVTLSENGLVERPMYLTDAATGYTGSADVIGVSNPATAWYFAEGYSASNFSERYIISNPSTSTANVTVTFIEASGPPVAVNISVNPGALQIVSAASAIGTSNVNNSATVTSNQPVVAERFMSFDYNSIPGATDVIGTTQPGYWFGFAEGYTGAGFSEYLTLENPDPTNTAYVAITYLPANGSAPTQQVVAVAPDSRYTINTSSEMANQSFSMVVESGVPIVAERPMYFNFSGDTGGSDVVGFQLY